MAHFACFGYGSLVNTQTLHDQVRVRPARITGWRRAWRVAGSAPTGNRCSLAAVPDPDCHILGLVVMQHIDRRADMDKREGWYTTSPLADDRIDWLEPAPDDWPELPDPVGIFVAKPVHARTGDAEYPVMLSYVDTVIAGYRDRFGQEGVDHFLQTTADWHVPILDDRAAPSYPRAVNLSRAERDYVDHHLGALGANVVGRRGA